MSGVVLAVAVGAGCAGAVILAGALVRDILDTTKGSRTGARFWRKAS
jgi:hypothetical protein